MGRVVGTHRAGLAGSASLLLLALMLVAWPAAAVEPPPELNYVCVDSRDVVHYAATPNECGAKETLRTLPDDRPVYWCADHLGRLDEANGPGACSARELALTVPDDGVIFVCAGNIRGGTTLPRGELRTVADISDCDPDETGLVTPAAPEGIADAHTIDEDTELVVPDKGVLDNDLDLTGAPLTAELVTAPAKGMLALSDAGGFRYDPRGVFDGLDAGESASTTFTYVADDGALTSEPTTVTITITGRNDRPVAVDDVITTDEDTVVQVTPPGVLGNDSDAEGHPLTSSVVDGPALGDLDLSADGALRFDPRADFQHLGATPGDDGESTFTYVARDGSTASDAATVRVEVVGVNDAPVGGADAFATDENTVLEISPAQLLGNDTDAEGQSLSVTQLSFPGSGSGVFDVLPDGTVRFDPDADSGDPDSVPDFDHLTEGQQAVVELTYRAYDGDLASSPVTVTIVVHGLSAPTANDDVRTTGEDTAIAIDLFGNDEVRGGTLALDLAGTQGSVIVETEGVVRYDPSGAFDHLAAGATGTDTFDYTLTNNEGSSTGTVTVAVSGSNDAPVAVDDSYQVQPGTVLVVPGADSHDPDVCETDPCDLLANDTDVDTPHQDLLARLVSPPDRGRLSLMPDGGFSFDPAGEFGDAGGQTTFSYRADDGAAQSATATVTLVVSTNKPPVFSAETHEFTILVDAAPGSEVGAVAATDGDGDLLTFSLLDADTDAFELDPATGVLTVGSAGSPPVGTYELTLGVTDGRGGADSAVVTVHVVPEINAVDDEYVAVGNTELVGGTPEPGSFSDRAAVRVGSLLANDGGATEVTPQSDLTTGKGGSVDIAADGSFVYTPPAADPNADPAADPPIWDGQAPLQDSFDYQLTGTGVTDATGAVTVTVLDAVWYVDNAWSTAGSGTAWDPYGSLTGVSGNGSPADKDLPGQTVFLFGHPDVPDDTPDDPDTTPDESAHPGGIALEDGQSLVGEGSGLTVPGPDGDITVVLPGVSPRVTAPDGAAAVTLAADNQLRGFTVGGDGHGIVGTAPGALTADLTTVLTTGNPLRLVAGAPADLVDVNIGLVGSIGPAGALVLDGLRGSVLVGEADLAQGGGIAVNAAPAVIDPATGDVEEPPGHVDITTADVGTGRLAVTGNAGNITVGDLTGSGGSTGIDLTGNTGTVTLGMVHLDGVTGTGIAIADDDGTSTIGGGEVSGDSESLSGALLAVTGGADSTSGSIDIGADLLLEPADLLPALHSGRSVDITGVGAGGTVEVSGDVVDRGLGIEITDVPGTVRLTGGVNVVTASTPALHAARVGTLEVPLATTNVMLSSASAAAVHLEQVVVGDAGAILDRVDSAGAVVAPGPHTTGTGIIVDRVTATPGPGLRINGGTVRASEAAGVAVLQSSGVTLRGLLIDDSAGDGIVVEDAAAATPGGTGLTLQGVRVLQPDLVGIDAVRSGDLLLDGTTVSSAGSNGVRLTDLRGPSTLLGSTIENSRDTQLLVTDGAKSTGVQDAVVIDSSVVNGAEPEDDSIRVTTMDDNGDLPGAGDLEFRVAGATPSGSIGGDVGLNASAVGGSRLHVDLDRFAVAATASDAVRLNAAGTGTQLTFDLSTMNNEGGGGIQFVGGAGVRVVGDGDATISGTMNRVNVVSTEDSGIVLDRVSCDQVTCVTMDIVGVQATGLHGIEITDSAGVSMDQVEVVDPAEHGLRVFQGTDVVLDDSRIDMRPPPPAEADEQETYDAFSAVWMRHLGGTDNAVTDTTLRGSTGDQLVVLEGTTVSPLPGEPAPPMGAPMTATIQLSGLTLTETALDPLPDDSVVREGDAVKVVAGTDAHLTVDLDGTGSSRTDETMRLSAERGGDLTVTGGHPIVHDGADGEQDGPDESLRLEATGANAGTQSTLGVAIDGLSVTQVAPADPTVQQMPGHALVVEADSGDVDDDSGGRVRPAVPGTPSISDSTVRSAGAANAVHVLADGPDSTLEMSTSGLDVAFAVPAGFTGSTADPVSVTGKGTGVVSDMTLAGGTIAGHGGEAIDVQTEETVIPQPFPNPPIVFGHGTVASLTVDGVAVTGGGGDPIEATGQVGDITVRGTTVTGGGGNGINVFDLVAAARRITIESTTVSGNGGAGIHLVGPACATLSGNNTQLAGGVGYSLHSLALDGFRDADHPTETVAEWLARFGNTGPPSPNFETHSPATPAGCTP
jgi:VCBS repeat-containing protein